MDILQMKDSGTRLTNHLNPDLDRGFQSAVANNQLKLALEHVVPIIVQLKFDLAQANLRIAALEARVASSTTQPQVVEETAEPEEPKKPANRRVYRKDTSNE